MRFYVCSTLKKTFSSWRGSLDLKHHLEQLCAAKKTKREGLTLFAVVSDDLAIAVELKERVWDVWMSLLDVAREDVDRKRRIVALLQRQIYARWARLTHGLLLEDRSAELVLRLRRSQRTRPALRCFTGWHDLVIATKRARILDFRLKESSTRRLLAYSFHQWQR